MIRKPQRYFVSIGLLLVVAGLMLRALGRNFLGDSFGDFLAGVLMGGGITLELVGLLQAKRGNKAAHPGESRGPS